MPRGVLVSSFGRPVCSVAEWVPHSTVLASGVDCVWPSSQRRSGSWPFFFWACCLSPSPGVGSASAAWQVLPFTWAFSMRGFFMHGGLASGSSGSLPSRFEQLVSLQGASDSMTHFSPEGMVVFSGSGIAVRTLLLATSLTLTMVLPLTFLDGSLSLR